MKTPEEEIGISVYWTDEIPGIGGRLKREPEDFVVEEISRLPPENADGDFSAVLIKHRNWELNRLVRRLSINLRIGRNKIAFAGTKDKRSIATQLMTFKIPLEALAVISIPDVEFLSMYRTRTPTRLGALLGNRFRIVVNDVQPEEIENRLESVTAEILQLDGFPSFFGVQRFGVIRPVTHLIGKAIIRGDFEKAAMIYLTEDTEYEATECRKARQLLAETKDFKKAMETFPSNLVFERTLLNHLSKHPTDFSGAIEKLPKNLVMMFVHAYQSFLFNRILSRRIERKIPLNEPIEGDVILPQDRHGLPDHRRHIPATSSNLESIRKQVKDGLGFVSGSLFGSESVLAEGSMGEIEREVIGEEAIERQDFIVPDLMLASSKGIRRELIAQVRNLSWSVDSDSVCFSFELNKGCYATSLLREYMKSEMRDY